MNYNYQDAMRAQRGYGQSARHREQPQWRIILFTFVMGLVVSVLISKLGSAKILGLTMLGWFFLIAIFLGLGMLPDLLDKSRHRREQRARADRQEQRARADRRDEIDRLAAYDRAGPALLRQLTDAGFTLADAKEAQKRSSTLAGCTDWLNSASALEGRLLNAGFSDRDVRAALHHVVHGGGFGVTRFAACCAWITKQAAAARKTNAATKAARAHRALKSRLISIKGLLPADIDLYDRAMKRSSTVRGCVAWIESELQRRRQREASERQRDSAKAAKAATAAKEADAKARAAQVATTDEYGPLPAGWVCSTRNGRTFYYRQQGPTQWTRPQSGRRMPAPRAAAPAGYRPPFGVPRAAAPAFGAFGAPAFGARAAPAFGARAAPAFGFAPQQL
jgi:hypothetical protein